MSRPTDEIFPISELRSTGMLWLINRVVFHPRGFALAVVTDDDSGEVRGWRMLGDGSEAWSFESDEPEASAAFRFLDGLRADHGRPGASA